MIDDELDERLVRAARPAPGVSPGTLDTLAREAREQGRWLHRRRVVGVVAGGVLALTAGLIAAPAAADGIQEFLARTGDVCDFGTECTEGDPVIDLSASDLPELVHADYPEYLELAPGTTRTDIEAAVVERLAQPDALTFETAIGQQYENIAYCGWVTEWLDADGESDATRSAIAADVMRRAIAWPAMASATDETWEKVQDAFATAAETGDRTGVRAASVINICGEEPDSEVNAWLDEMAETL